MGNESGGGGADATEDEGGGVKEDAIRDVWMHNLETEFRRIREVVQKYPFISMDTEFPGIVAKPLGEFLSHSDFNYQMVSCNVNLLKLIQVGLSFMNEKGETPPGASTWQFNFKFNLATEMYSQESIQLLQDSAIDFGRLEKEGMTMADFGELLTTSGLICSDNVTWLSFHSSYDFGYVMRAITGVDLPKTQEEFSELRQLVFPNMFDLKLLLKQPAPRDSHVRGGLQEIAEKLGVTRIGPQHQAGSDALLTGQLFFTIKERFFASDFASVAGELRGKLYGLTPSAHHGHHHHLLYGGSTVGGGDDDESGGAVTPPPKRIGSRNLLDEMVAPPSPDSNDGVETEKTAAVEAAAT